MSAWRKTIVAGVCLALPLGGYLASVAAEQAAAPKKAAARPVSAPKVSVVEARRATFIDNILVSGSLVPREEVLVGPEIDGYRITGLLAEEGDHVKAGQVLARLSRDTLEAQLAQNTASESRADAAIDQAQSQIAENEATLKQAEDAFQRVKPLLAKGVESQATFDQREMSFDTARAKLAAQKQGLRLTEADRALIAAQRKELEVKLGHTEIQAPASGIISRRTARLGQVSSATAEPLFRIVKDSEIELNAEVPEFDLGRLKAGQHAVVEIEGAGERDGTVRLVAPEVSATSRLGNVRIFLGRAPDLHIGTFAKATIDAGERDSVSIPATAVLYRNGGATVLAVDGGKVVERNVKTGLLSGDSVEIRDGLKEGEAVVMRAASLLHDGDRIDPQFAEKRTAAETGRAEAAE